MTEIVRKLDGVEAAMAWRHASLRGTSQVTNLLTLEGTISPEKVETAFRRVYSTYETLRLRLFESGGDFYFARGGECPPGAFVSTNQGDAVDIKKVLEHEINTVLDPTLGLWRYRLIHDSRGNRSHVVLTRHHAMSDGFTGERLLASFLHNLDLEEPLPPLPSPVAHTSGPAALMVSTPGTFDKVAPPKVDESGLWFPHFATAPLEARSTGIVLGALPEPVLADILVRCLSEGVTVHSAITTIFSRAFAEIAHRDQINVFTAISLRKDLSPEGLIEDFGCFIGVARSSFEQQVCPVEAARAYASGIRGAASRVTLDRRDQAEIRRSIETLGKSGHNRGLMVSNLGSLGALRAATKRTILDYRGVSNRNGGLFALGLHVTFLDGVRLTCNFTRPLTPDEFAEAVLINTIARLETLASKGFE